MRKLSCVGLALVLGASAVLAGGPPDRRGPGGDRRGQFDFMRSDQFRGDVPGLRNRGVASDALRRYFDLTPEQQAALTKLDDQRAADEREAMNTLAKSLDKKYAALILEVLPADQKAKYEQVLAALTAREDATEAAQKDFRTVLTKVRADQGVTGRPLGGFLPNSKGELIRQCINLTEAQHGAIDGVQRDAWGNMRDKTRDIARPQDWRDAAARQKYSEAIRKVREQVDNQAAEAMALLLNEAQKTAYQTAAASLDVCNKKVAEADDTCEKKLTELVGAEKAKAMRAGWWQFPGVIQPGGPGGPPPKGGENPKGEAPKATEF